MEFSNNKLTLHVVKMIIIKNGENTIYGLYMMLIFIKNVTILKIKVFRDMQHLSKRN